MFGGEKKEKKKKKGEKRRSDGEVMVENRNGNRLMREPGSMQECHRSITTCATTTAAAYP